MFVTDQVSFEDSLTYTNKTFHESGKTIKYQTESNLYDLKLDAVIKLSANNKVYTGKEDLLLLERSNISLIREEDELKHNLLQKRCDDSWIENGNYFKKINKILKKNMITINR
jgi:hemolysin activation/secretion protein